VGTVGLLEDRSRAIPMHWGGGDEIWLLGASGWDAGALAGSELAWRRGRFGGMPALDQQAAARLVALLGRLTTGGLLTGAHDISVGGLGVALARLAIASSLGATVTLPPEAAVCPTAGLFGERGGRVVVAVAPETGAALVAAADAADVWACRLGLAGGSVLRVAAGDVALALSLDQLQVAWTTPFPVA
jgi:phosphoribosylformylglycinamidine synthase